MPPTTRPLIAPERRASVEALFSRNVDAVFNIAYRVLWNRPDAEDVVQRSFIKALTSLDQLRDPTAARPWLLKVAYREAIASLRARRELPVDPHGIPERASESAGPAERVVAANVARVLSDALKRMNDDERMAVVLRDIEQLPMRDVADVIGVGLSAAKMRVHRGRAALRLLVAGEDIR